MRIVMPSRAVVPAIISAILVGIFYVLTIRGGHDWGDDFSMYIRHAENIAQGLPYGETGYIYNPHNPSVGPRTYPPGFPLLIAPVAAFSSPNPSAIEPFKIVVIAFAVASLLMMVPLFRDALGAAPLAALILIVGFNPTLWAFKDQILSDIPFLFFVLVSLFLYLRSTAPDVSPRSTILHAALAGATAYAAYATRTIGFVLVPAFIAGDLLRRKRADRTSLIAAGVFLAFAATQYGLWLRDDSYLDQVNVTLGTARYNLVAYFRALSNLWHNGYSAAGRKGIFLLSSGLVVLGYSTVLRSTHRGVHLFPLMYVIVVLLWPSEQGVRFLIPILPFYVLYCLLGVRRIDDALRLRTKGKQPAFIGFLVLVAVTYAARYSTLEYGPLHEGIAKEESVQLFDFVKTATAPTDVLVFGKPRALALFTGRRVSAAFIPDHPCALWRYMRQIRASHVIIGPDDSDPESAYLERLAETFSSSLTPLFKNRDFAAYRIDNYPCN